jgi:uncharacterized phage protein (TIGR01671 family)
MREILFRGKRTHNGEWVYGDLIRNSKVDCFTYIAKGTGCKVDDAEIGKAVKVFPSTVGQYTGLTDKNRKKIFEGDIVRTKHGDVKKIIYKDYWGAFGVEYGLLFDKESGKHVKAHGGLSHFYGDSQFYEVIGNIHDNPELLEEAK